MRAKALRLGLFLLLGGASTPLLAQTGTAPAASDQLAPDDGYRLWMRYPARTIAPDAVTVRGRSATLDAAAAELRRGLPAGFGPVLLATAGDPHIQALRLPSPGPEGYVVRRASIGGRATVVVTGDDERGVLYGAFALLRQVATDGASAAIDLRSRPRVALRVLDHWDNLDGVVERGYAGKSLWDWWTLPDYRDPRYTDYARANAAIGINGTVLNNVNAKAESLTAPYIAKAI